MTHTKILTVSAYWKLNSRQENKHVNNSHIACYVQHQVLYEHREGATNQTESVERILKVSHGYLSYVLENG